MKGLELANPAGLWALALLAPVVLLHLYSRRRRRMEVAFLPLLRETAGTTSAQGAWRNVHETLSLLLRGAALAAAALALAGPRPALAGPPPRDLVLVIDGDVTTNVREEMRTHDGEACFATRFVRQIDLAESLVASNAHARVGVLLASDFPVVVAALGEDPRKGLASLRKTPERRGRADLGSALALAGALGTPAHPVHVVALTSRSLPPGTPAGVEALGAGSISDDQGFVDQSVEASPDGVHRTVRLVVRNFGSRPRRRTVRGFLESGGEAFMQEVDLQPRADVALEFQVVPPRDGDSLRVVLEAPDTFPDNDSTGAWLAPSPRASVLVVHAGAERSFVAATLDAMGDAIDRERSGSVHASDLAKASPRDVTIVDGAALPIGVPLKGGWIFLAPFGGPGVTTAPFKVGRSVTQPLVWRSDETHPLLRGVDLSTTYVARAVTIDAPSARGLAYAEGEPVLVEGTSDVGGQWVAFGLDPDGSDLPLRAALPVLLRNAVRRVGTRPLEMLRAFYRPGEAVRPRVEVPGFAWQGGVLSSHSITTLEVRPCDEPPRIRETVPPLAPLEGLVAPFGGRGEPARFTGRGPETFTTAFVDLSPEYDVVPVRPAATPPPPAPPAPDRDAAAALWRAILIASAAALLLADLLLLAIRGSADRRGIVAATPANA